MIIDLTTQEPLIFNIIRLLELGYSYDQLVSLGYNPELVSLLIRIRAYVLKSNFRRLQHEKGI